METKNSLENQKNAGGVRLAVPQPLQQGGWRRENRAGSSLAEWPKHFA
ncbi:hypothetical protein [Ottowia oryzae]